MVKVFNFLIFHYLAPHYLFQSYGLVDVLRMVNSVKFLISLSKWYCLNTLHNIRYLTSLKKMFFKFCNSWKSYIINIFDYKNKHFLPDCFLQLTTDSVRYLYYIIRLYVNIMGEYKDVSLKQTFLWTF